MFVRACLLPFHGDFPPIFDFIPLFLFLSSPCAGMPKRLSRFSKPSVQAAYHQSLISRRNLILQNLEHGKHRKILQTRDNLSLKTSTAADFIAVESCFFRRLPVFDLQYYIPGVRSACGEDMSSHQNSSTY